MRFASMKLYLRNIWYRNHQHQLGLLAHSHSAPISHSFSSPRVSRLEPLNFISCVQLWHGLKDENKKGTCHCCFRRQLRSVINLCKKIFLSFLCDRSFIRLGACFWPKMLMGRKKGRKSLRANRFSLFRFLQDFRRKTKLGAQRQATFIVTTPVDYKIKSFEQRVGEDKSCSKEEPFKSHPSTR